jgi:hypothetical protein
VYNLEHGISNKKKHAANEHGLDWAPYEANKISAKGYGDSWKNAKEGNTIPPLPLFFVSYKPTLKFT